MMLRQVGGGQGWSVGLAEVVRTPRVQGGTDWLRMFLGYGVCYGHGVPRDSCVRALESPNTFVRRPSSLHTV